MTLLFLLPPFDTPTWHCRPAWQRKRNTDGFLLTWFMFVFLQRVAFVISHLKMQDHLRGKSRSHFLIALINPVTLKEREQTKQQDSRSFCPQIRLRFSGRKTTVIVVFPTVLCTLNCVCSLIRCWYETLLVVFV